MRSSLIVLLVMLSAYAHAGGAFKACAFEAVINGDSVEFKGMFRVEITPVSRVLFKHKLWEDAEAACPKFSVPVVITVPVKNTLQVHAGETIRLVKVFHGGELPPKGEERSEYDYRLWDEKAFTTSN